MEDFKRIDEIFRETRPDMVLLDLNLHYLDGFYWCRQIRLISNCPILFISAQDGVMNQEMDLENGADDYVTEPLVYDVLIAKSRSLLRRAMETMRSKITNVL